MELYIYKESTLEVQAIVKGETNEACETKAAELNFDDEEFGWSYSDCDLVFGAGIEEFDA